MSRLLFISLHKNIKLSDQQCEVFFIEYFNNFLSTRRFAEYYEITEKKANLVIRKGDNYHTKKHILLNGYYHNIALKARAKRKALNGTLTQKQINKNTRKFVLSTQNRGA